MQEQVFKWLDAHVLDLGEVPDFNYLSDILYNYEEEFGELDDDEVIKLICDYQIYFLKKVV
jgi:hypothetical protein